MKNHVVNKDKIQEAFILEPYQAPSDIDFIDDSRGWQVVLVFGYVHENFLDKIVIEKNSEEECVKLIESLAFSLCDRIPPLLPKGRDYKGLSSCVRVCCPHGRRGEVKN